MSKYTTEVRFICETEAGLLESQGFNSVDNILTTAAPKVFSFDWPIFDENYRLPLEVKILRHYYTREIGAETVGLFKLQLQQKLCEIMPYYNQLYKSQLLDFDPFADVDLTTDHVRSGQGDNTSNTEEDIHNTLTVDEKTSNSGNKSENGNNNNTNDNTNTNTGTAWNLYSDTPQGSVQNIGLEGNSYLTNATKNTNNGTITDTGHSDTTYTDKSEYSDNGTRDATNTTVGDRKTNTQGKYSSTEDYLQHIKGRNGGRSYMKDLIELRDTFLNIDKMIIDELAPLFFNLW